MTEAAVGAPDFDGAVGAACSQFRATGRIRNTADIVALILALQNVTLSSPFPDDQLIAAAESQPVAFWRDFYSE